MSNINLSQKRAARLGTVGLRLRVSFFAIVSFVACGGSSSPPIINGTVVVTSSPPGLKLLAIDANNLYWITFPNVAPPSVVNDLYATPKSGGPNTKLGQTSASSIGGVIGLDATTVYFPLNDQILAVPIGGGSSRVVASGSATTSIALANGNVYWADEMGIVHSVAASGGTPQVIPLPSADVQATGATSTLASTDAVYADFPNGLLGIPYDGSTPTWNGSPDFGFTVDATNLYSLIVEGFGNSGNYNVVSVTKPNASSAGQVATIAVAEYPGRGLAVDDQFVYFDDSSIGAGLGRIRKVPKGGGSVTSLANYKGNPGNLFVDDANVYWDDFSDGTIKKIAKQ